jgi:hypothetical protein
MQAADTGGAGNAACVAVWSVLVGCRVGASEACTVRWRSRLYCPLVHVGLAFAKLFSIQKLEPQVAFLSIASSVPLPDPWILNTWRRRATLYFRGPIPTFRWSTMRFFVIDAPPVLTMLPVS